MSQDPLKGTVPALRVAISASIALGCMAVDFVLLMRDEVGSIWPRLRVSWTARMYLLARYLGLASQIFNVCFTVRMYLGVETTPAGCRFWFAYQALVVQLLLAIVEGMLMHRIYALFLRNRIVLMVLISFAIGQTVSMWVSARLSFPSNKHTVTCLIVRSNPGNAFFSITTMTTNIIIFFMTFWRYFQLPVKWTRQGLGRIVFRDSGFSLGAISLMMFFMTLCSLQVIKPSMSGNITYYWFVCVLWISIGRLIVNHEKLLRDEREHGGLEFTSQFDTNDSVWTLEAPRLDKISSGQWRMTPTTPTTLMSTARNSFLPTPTTKASQIFGAPPSSPGCTSEDGSVRREPVGDQVGRLSAVPPPEMEVDVAEMEVPCDFDESQPQPSSSLNGFASGISRTNHPRPDADAGANAPGHRPERSPSPPLWNMESDVVEKESSVPQSRQSVEQPGEER